MLALSEVRPDHPLLSYDGTGLAGAWAVVAVADLVAEAMDVIGSGHALAGRLFDDGNSGDWLQVALQLNCD